MANQEDYLDRVWIKVINLDPNGSWIQDCLGPETASLFPETAPALNRILARNPSPEQLGRFYRYVRFKACSNALRCLEQPGLKKGNVRGLYGQLDVSLQQPRKALTEPKFIRALWKIIDPKDDGKWIKDFAKEIPPGGPFEDVPHSVKLLLKKKLNLADLGAVAPWHRHEAIFQTLHLMEEEGFEKATEIPGLHEILLGLDPSGKEGGQGSWPFLRKPS